MLIDRPLKIRRSPSGNLAEEIGLREVINDFLTEKFGIDVSFDIRDALERLIDQGLVQESPAGDFRAMPLRDASRHLYERWCAALAQR